MGSRKGCRWILPRTLHSMKRLLSTLKDRWIVRRRLRNAKEWLHRNNHPLAKNVIELLNDTTVQPISHIQDHIDELRTYHPANMTDEQILRELNEDALKGYYFNSKIFMSTRLDDNEYLSTLFHETEHHRHSCRTFSNIDRKDTFISEMMSYHAENLLKVPQQYVTRGYLKSLREKTHQMIEGDLPNVTIEEVPLHEISCYRPASTVNE